jgi:hypothetical protein
MDRTVYLANQAAALGVSNVIFWGKEPGSLPKVDEVLSCLLYEGFQCRIGSHGRARSGRCF